MSPKRQEYHSTSSCSFTKLLFSSSIKTISYSREVHDLRERAGSTKRSGMRKLEHHLFCHLQDRKTFVEWTSSSLDDKGGFSSPLAKNSFLSLFLSSLFFSFLVFQESSYFFWKGNRSGKAMILLSE